MGPVCTIMVGRLDDWIKVAAESEQVTLDPGYYEWAGVAAFKKAYGIYRERGYRTRLLSAAFRNHMHWSEFIGGDVVISPPFGWQVRLNSSGIEPDARIHDPVDPRIVDALYGKLAEFRKAYDEDGLTVAEFDAVRRDPPHAAPVPRRQRRARGARPRRAAAQPRQVTGPARQVTHWGA